LNDDLTRPSFLAITGMRLRNAILRRYSLRGAKSYEKRRQSVRWGAEARAFEQFYTQINPRKVLDLPVGTGRFFDAYLKNNAEVLGVDISANMLAEATTKIPQSAPIKLLRADVLDLKQPSPLGSGYDLIVCMRFIYWLRPRELAIMLRKFNATGAPLLIASTKVALDRPARIVVRGWRRSLKNLRAHFYRAVVKQVYTEDELFAIFSANGWTLMASEPLVTTRSVRYFCYLFSAQEMPASPKLSTVPIAHGP
jgi:SAM-dependent methyltransferase